jgi:DNA polymerase
VLRLRDQRQPAAKAEVIQGTNPLDALRDVLARPVAKYQYPIISVESGDIIFLDLDTHQLADKPSEEELDAWGTSNAPMADLWWRTHGAGLRLVFCGPQYEERAIAAALATPRFFEIELKQDSRHPAGAHPNYTGAKCGPVHVGEWTGEESVDWSLAGPLDPGVIEEVLADRGMQPGRRYDHDKCPIDGNTESEARDCVVALEAGIYCHRCAGKGLSHPACTASGFVPFRALTDRPVTSAVISDLARNLVHWTHAEVHLREEHPNLGSVLLKKAYELVLQEIHGQDDPRIGMALNADLQLLQGEQSWFDPETQREIQLTDRTLKVLPGLFGRIRPSDEEGHAKPKLLPRNPLFDRARQGIPLDGYKPCRFVRGVVLHEDRSVLQLAVDPERGEPVRLLKARELLPLNDAFAELAVPFPDFDQAYLQACLAAAICAEHGGRPPILVAVGPTGSGKGEIVRLAASILGDDRMTIALSTNEEQMWRRIGSAIEGGHRFLVLDEFLRRGNFLPELIAFLLQLAAIITWRRLYRNGDIHTPNRAAYFLSAGCVPDGFKKSPEICRRMWLARLCRQVPEWTTTCGGDTAEWRTLSKQNARTANSILTHAYSLCAEHEFNFDHVATALGLCRIDEGDAEMQRDVLRDLYRYCRDEFGNHDLDTSGRYKDGGWVKAMAGPCQELLQQLLPDEDTAANPDAAGQLFQLQQNLQMVPWNKTLGIDEPPIRCEMRRHGATVVIRFIEGTPGLLRGQHRINEQLPPIPGSDGEGPDGDGGLPVGPTEPATDPTGPFCQQCQEPWQNANPVGEVAKAEITPAEQRSARSASSASLFMKQGGEEQGDEEGGTAEAGAEVSLPKTVAELAEPIFTPANADKSASTAGRTLTELAERAASRAINTPTAAGEALAAAEFPQPMLTLDFETYYDSKFSLSKISTPEYVHDPRFHVHGLAIRWPDGQTEFATDPVEALQRLRSEFGDDLEEVTVIAHNAPFDAYILAKKYDVHPRFICDTLSLARHVYPGQENKLGALASRLGLPPKGDALKGLSGVRELSPAQLAELSAYAKHDAELCYQAATLLLPRISRPEVELKVVDLTVRMFTERAVAFDVGAARSLLEQAEASLDEVLEQVGIDRKTAGGKAFEHVLAEELAKGGCKVPTKPGKKGDIAALAKNDDGMKKLLADPNPRVQALAKARLAMKSAPQVTKRLQNMIHIAERTGGVLPVSLKYCGAHTGRFSGDGGINLQNLPAHVSGLAGQIRGLLRAGEGHSLVIADAAQIEARVLAWLAGQNDLVDAFARGEDIYSVFASTVFGEEVRKPRSGDSPELKAKLEVRRKLGKVAVLGLGYQMGKDRFIGQVRFNPDLAAMLNDNTLSEAFLVEVHATYRRTYANIPALWYAVQDAFCTALRQGRGNAAGIEFTRDGDVIYAQLPSGRRLCYHEPNETMTGDLEYVGGKLYGGLLVENIVQAISRDILVDAMLELERSRRTVVLTVHDEIVLQVPAAEAKQALAETTNALSATPAWAPGLPLATEGRIADRYGK